MAYAYSNKCSYLGGKWKQLILKCKIYQMSSLVNRYHSDTFNTRESEAS